MGCAAQQMYTVEYVEYIEPKTKRIEKSSNDYDLYVFTNDSSKIEFSSDMYRFLEDTLDGMGSYIITKKYSKLLLKDPSEPMRMLIPFSNIALSTHGEQDLYLITTDSTELFFRAGSYLFNHDSLQGMGQLMYSDSTRFGIEIKYAEVQKMQIPLRKIIGIGSFQIIQGQPVLDESPIGVKIVAGAAAGVALYFMFKYIFDFAKTMEGFNRN